MGLAAAHAKPVLSRARDGGDEFVGGRLAGATAVSNDDAEAPGGVRSQAIGAEPVRPGGFGEKSGA